jgi:hypothetical protein
MRSYLNENLAAPVQKTKINGREDPAALTTRHRSIRKSWHKNSQTSGGRQSVQFACGLKATEFVFIL